MTKLRETERTRLRRFHGRGSLERPVIDAILDAAPMASIGFIHAGRPAVLPMAFWRSGDHVYFHGSSRNRMIASLLESPECCFVAGTIDALVLAKAAIHHSMNYRSVVIYGKAEEIPDKSQKMSALKQFIELFFPGRWAKVREPDAQELKSVRIMRLEIEEASAKTRNGQPVPYADDMNIPVWTGIVPVQATLGEAIPNPDDPGEFEVPAYVYHRRRTWRFPSD